MLVEWNAPQLTQQENCKNNGSRNWVPGTQMEDLTLASPALATIVILGSEQADGTIHLISIK